MAAVERIYIPAAMTNRIYQVYRELDNIVRDGGMAARLPQALMDRLKAMRGMLLEELETQELDSRLASDWISTGAVRRG
jgi:hypothetical protein